MRCRIKALIAAHACVALLATGSLAAEPRDEISDAFTKFVAAQNAHDLKGVEDLLSDSPNFLWATRDLVVHGRAEAVRHFERLFQGTWRVDADRSTFEVLMLDWTTAQIIVNLAIADGSKGQPTPPGQTLMNLIMVKAADGWRVLSILPVNLPATEPGHRHVHKTLAHAGHPVVIITGAWSLVPTSASTTQLAARAAMLGDART